MNDDQCNSCPLLFCDFISRECRLKASEILTHRPDLIGLDLQTPEHKLTLARQEKADKDKRIRYNKRHKTYYAKNKDKINAVSIQWAKDHREVRNAYQRNNRDKVNKWQRNYRAKIKSLGQSAPNGNHESTAERFVTGKLSESE